MRTSQQFRFFFGGGIFEEIFFILMLVNFSDVWIFFFGALFKRAAIFTTPLNLMDFFHVFKVVNSNGVCFFFKKAQCISGIYFPKKISYYFFFKEIFCFWKIILALWKGGRLEK